MAVIVYRAAELDIETRRTHPWTFAESDPSCRYVDFRQEPEKIETSLEDFRPWEQYPAVQRFYAFLRWLNGPDSSFETNDCLLRLEDNTDPNHPYKLQASGRLMLFPFDMRLTCAPGFADWMMSGFHCYLTQIQPPLSTAAVGLSKAPCLFESVNAKGHEMVFYFWAWGDTNEATMNSLDRVFERLQMASKKANADVRDSLRDVQNTAS